MNQNERDQLMSLIRDAERLVDSLKRYANPEAALVDSAEVQAKVNQRICLACGVHVPKDGFYLRGLHQTCYNTTMRRIRQGTWKEEDRIKEGLLSVGGKPGKQAVIDIAAQKSVSESAGDDVDKKLKRLSATKKARKKEAD